mgnify:CR=1 FL=1
MPEDKQTTKEAQVAKEQKMIADYYAKNKVIHVDCKEHYGSTTLSMDVKGASYV